MELKDCVYIDTTILLKKFAKPEFLVMRAVLFIVFGSYSFIPGVQLIVLDGFAYATAAYSLSGLLKCHLCVFPVQGSVLPDFVTSKISSKGITLAGVLLYWLV